jgi:hypothetical protein
MLCSEKACIQEFAESLEWATTSEGTNASPLPPKTEPSETPPNLSDDSFSTLPTNSLDE